MPSLKWYVYPAIDFTKRLYGRVTTDNQTLYLTDGVIAVPVRFSSYLSWYDPSTGALTRMLNLQEAWDHVNEYNPIASSPYLGTMVLLAGYRSWLLAVNVTDGSQVGEVWIIRRYTDDSILVYNRGYPYALPVDVNDPPSSLGYSVQTNGTRGTGKTTLSQGQYVLFYKGTAPQVDAASGLFATSPIGSSKSKDYEVKHVSTYYVSTVGGSPVHVPTLYTGIRAPGADVEVGSSGRMLKVYRNRVTYAGISYGGFGVLDSYNVSGLNWSADTSYGLDVGLISAPLKVYSGWAEDDAGNVKVMVFSVQSILMNNLFVPLAKRLTYLSYDADIDEENSVSMVRPLILTLMQNARILAVGGVSKSSLLEYIDTSNTWHSDTSSVSQPTDVQNVWGYFNVYTDTAICAAAITVVYTNDPDFSNVRPDATRGYSIADLVGMAQFKIGTWIAKDMTTGRTYLVGVRVKEFPPNATRAEVRAWIQNRPFKVVTDISRLPMYPLTAWLVGNVTDTVTVNCPAVVTGGQPFTVNVSCPTRPNKTAYVMVVDGYGNVVSSAQGTLGSDGRASISVTAPQQVGRYKVYAVVAGDRTVP